MALELIDTHTHLNDERFEEDRDAVIERAVAAGVGTMLCIGITRQTSQEAVALAETHDQVLAVVGIQPNYAHEASDDDWSSIVELADHPRVVGLGETGLDHYWDFCPLDLQEEYFRRHLALARQTGLPFVVHCREAESDVVALLREDFEQHGPCAGLMHSFCGDLATAEACLAMGLMISFAGMVTYKRSHDLRAVAAAVPADRLLVETDCPYLSPEPVRKIRRNEPAHVRHTAELLAEVRGVSLAELAAQTTANARRLFNLADVG